MNMLLLRFFLILPWLGLLWLIALGIEGQISALLVFCLLFILIPGAIVLNLVTVIAFQGQAVFKVARNVQKSRDVGNQRLRSENYADLPWWHPKRWL
jgi:hypothetical protein